MCAIKQVDNWWTIAEVPEGNKVGDEEGQWVYKVDGMGVNKCD